MIVGYYYLKIIIYLTRTDLKRTLKKHTMAKMTNYSNPTIDVMDFASERGFCATLQFTPTTQSFPSSSSFEMDDMTESTDNAAW